MADVPNAAGVPALLTGTSSSLSDMKAVSANAVTSLGNQSQQWGIFSGGKMVITADTVMDFSYKRESVIADYPLERGAFETYDKVAMPYEIRIRFIQGGSDAKKQALLASIEAIADDYNLYEVVTPSATYINANVCRREYRRTVQNGLGVLQADVSLRWVRIGVATGSTTVGSATNNSLVGGVQGNTGGLTVGDASLADQTNGGAVQAVAAALGGPVAAALATIN